VIDADLLSVIHRWHLRDQVSLREIAKRLGISRNTVRRYLRLGMTVVPPSTTGGIYLAVLQRKTGALCNGAPFTALPKAFCQLQALLLPSRRRG
jgi:AraC-like DNA-binding protein